METFDFNLVSPEKSLASLPANSVMLPGTEGDLTAMAGHMPLITALRPGILKVVDETGEKEFVVSGGFAEIGAGVTVLAEKAVLKSEFSQAFFQEIFNEAETLCSELREGSSMEPSGLDDAKKVIADLEHLGKEMGLEIPN